MTKSKVPHIRFKGFSGEWKEKKLDDIVDDLYNGQTPSRIVNSYWNGTINWLSSGELNRSVVTKTIEKISTSGQKSANLKLVSSGTFVMAITGLEAVGTRGNCAILGIDTTLNQSCMAIYPKKDVLNTPFLFHWYRKNSEEYGIKFTQGTKQQSYNATIIRKLDIVLPKIDEQAKIGEYFKQLDKLIEQKEKKYQKLRQFKKAMLSKMFPKNGADTPEIRFKGFSGKWEEKKLGDIGKTYTGLSGKTKEDFGHGEGRFITYMNIFSNPISKHNLIEPIEIDDKQNEVQLGDVFFTTSSETPEEVGMTSIWMNEGNNIYLNSFCFGYRPEKVFDHYYLAYMLRSSYIRKKIIFLAQGISRYNISKNKVMEIYVPIPDIKEQTKIGNYFQKLDAQIELQLQEIEKLKNIKKASLAKMFV